MMVKVFEGTKDEFYMDGYLQSNLDTAKTVIKADWDMIFAVDGAEGAGKSVMAMQVAKYCDPTFNMDRIAFHARDFKKYIREAKPYQAVVYDEAYAGLNSRAAMSFINRSLVSMLTEIRQKNLFVIIVMPCFFDLDKYVALWRSRALIHVYTTKKFTRGYIAFYNMTRKKQLYMKGKKLYEYSFVRPNFRGRFLNHYTVDEKEYRKRKAKSLRERESISEQAELWQMINQMLFEKVIKVGESVTHNQKMAILEMAPATYFRKLKRHRELVALS